MVMQIMLRRQWRENLEANRVRRHRCKMLVPDESQHAFTLLDARMLRHRLLAIRRALRRTHPSPGPRQTNPEEEDISPLERDTAVASDLMDLIERDHLPRQCIDANPLPLRVGDVVDKHAAARYTFLRPEADADPRRVGILDFVRRRAAVEHAARGVVGGRRGRVMVPESIPLRRLLRVEVVLVVESYALGNPFDTVFEGSAAESWTEYG